MPRVLQRFFMPIEGLLHGCCCDGLSSLGKQDMQNALQVLGCLLGVPSPTTNYRQTDRVVLQCFKPRLIFFKPQILSNSRLDFKRRVTRETLWALWPLSIKFHKRLPYKNLIIVVHYHENISKRDASKNVLWYVVSPCNMHCLLACVFPKE